MPHLINPLRKAPLTLLASLLRGSIPGTIIGGLLSARAPDRALRPVLAWTLAPGTFGELWGLAGFVLNRQDAKTPRGVAFLFERRGAGAPDRPFYRGITIIARFAR
jgi:uncharacterized membrane protein YfcA